MRPVTLPLVWLRSGHRRRLRRRADERGDLVAGDRTAVVRGRGPAQHRAVGGAGGRHAGGRPGRRGRRRRREQHVDVVGVVVEALVGECRRPRVEEDAVPAAHVCAGGSRQRSVGDSAGQAAHRRRVVAVGRVVAGDVGRARRDRDRRWEGDRLPPGRRLVAEGGGLEQLAARCPQAADVRPGVGGCLIEPDAGDGAALCRGELDPELHRRPVTRVDDRRRAVEVIDRVPGNRRRRRRRFGARAGGVGGLDREGVGRAVGEPAHQRGGPGPGHGERTLRRRADVGRDRVPGDGAPAVVGRRGPGDHRLVTGRRRGDAGGSRRCRRQRHPRVECEHHGGHHDDRHPASSPMCCSGTHAEH